MTRAQQRAGKDFPVTKNSKWQLVLYIIVVIAALVFTYLYARWQFDLCYPSVSDSVWYCLAHAVG